MKMAMGCGAYIESSSHHITCTSFHSFSSLRYFVLYTCNELQ